MSEEEKSEQGNPSGTVFEPLSEKNMPVKPCPFCGSVDIAIVEQDVKAIIGCTNCGCLGPSWYYRVELAIHGWNERPEL
jgi:hypothetical protein